ncbi:MAG: hypothetical protein WC423_07375 [Vulcanimicrobiota bacterium]
MRLQRSPGKRKRRGIVLISVVFIAILISMYVVSAHILNRSRFGGMKQTAENRLAEEAARSGLEYALARLEENPEWKGALNAVTVDTPELVVVEDRGNVIGILRTDVGTAQFRLRFNYQDGSGGGDDMDDPSSAMSFDSPHISLNNLTGGSDQPLYLGDGSGYSASSPVGVVKQGTVALAVEGRVSRELEQAGSSNPNPTLSQLEAVRVVDAYYRVNGITSESLTDAVGMAGGKFDARLYEDGARLLLGDTRENGKSTIRVRNGDFTVQDAATGNPGSVQGTEGEIRVTTGHTVQGDLAAGVTTGEEQTSDHFYQLLWGDVSPPTTGHTLPAGVYEVRGDGKVYRYEMNYEDYRDYKASNPDDTELRGAPVALDGSNGVSFVAQGEDYNGEPSDKHRLVFTDDVLVEPVGDVVDLTIAPARGAKEDLEDDPGGGGGGAITYRTGVDWLGTVFTNPPVATANISAKSSFLEGAIASLSDGDLHKLVLELADHGTIQMPGGGQKVTWSGQEVFSIEGDPDVLFDGLESGLSVTNMGGPNPEIFSEADLALAQAVVNIDANKLFEYFTSGVVASAGTLEEFASTDSTDVTDMELTFQPENQNGVRIANAEGSGGDIRIAADVRGTGGSLKSDGEIRLVGVGFEIDGGSTSSDNEGPGISLYAKDDIVLSTLKPDAAGNHHYTGMELKGLLYSWKNIELKAGHEDEAADAEPQRVYLQGAMVAYGGVPGDDTRPPGSSGGNILLSGNQLDLLYDPTHLIGLRSESGLTVSLEIVSRSFR